MSPESQNDAAGNCGGRGSMPVVFFSKIPQAILQMAAIHRVSGGVFVSNRPST